jgi:hypothetical protein
MNGLLRGMTIGILLEATVIAVIVAGFVVLASIQ